MKNHNRFTIMFGRAFGYELYLRRFLGDSIYNFLFGWIKTDKEKQLDRSWKIRRKSMV